MKNNGVEIYRASVSESSAYYKVELVKSGGTQGSNYLAGELSAFYKDAKNNKILVKNEKLSHVRSEKVKDNVYELVWDDFVLGPNVLELIGKEYAKINNKFVVMFPTNVNSPKAQLNQKMYKNLHKKYMEENKDKNESGYEWYIKLYDENITNVELILKVDKENKRLTLDLGFDALIEENILNGEKVKPIAAKNIKKPYNWIFFGAPGTGKSHELNEEMKKVLKNCESYYERVTFHPDYTYANFVGAYKPVSDEGNDIVYKFVPGPFIRLLVKALNNPEDPFILIIEEINRANVAAVFGDIFQLLDRVKNKKQGNVGESEYPIHVSEDMKEYLAEAITNDSVDYSTLVIPSNMYIWATMNSADQGVYMMDTAFKRRWDFKYMSLKNKSINNYEFVIGNQRFNWNNLRTAINDYLLGKGINEDKLLGPFFISPEYFYKKEDLDKKEAKLKDSKDDAKFKDSEEFLEIFKNKVLMYLFEDVLKARGRNDLFSGISTDKNLLFSQLQEEFDKKYFAIFTNEIADKFKIVDNKE